MADVITRLKLESGEYDSKIKRATQGLLQMEEECRKVGGTLGVLEKDQKDFVQSLGQMETVSKTARGRLSELTAAFVELRSQYNRLTDEEKKGDFGKALSSSLEQLKQRVADSRAELASVSQELNSTGQSSEQTSGILDQLASKFTINIDAVKLFNMGVQAAGAALDVARDAFFASEQNLDDWNRAVYSAQSVYEGFLTSLNTGNISGFLDNINTIVRAASEAYNALDRLGTMQTIQTPQLTAKQSEIQRMQMMLRTGRYVAPIDGRQNASGLKDGQVLTETQRQNIADNLKQALTEAGNIYKQQVGASTDAINALYKEQAAQLGMNIEQFRKGTSSMEAFDAALENARRYQEFERQHTRSVTTTGSGGIAVTTRVRDNEVNPYTAYRGWNVFKDDGQLYQRIVQEIQARQSIQSQYYGMIGQSYRGINRAEGISPSGSRTTTHQATPQESSTAKFEQAERDYQQSLQQAALELKAGTINSAEAKKKELQAAETLWKSIGDAREVYDSPKLKEAQAQVEAKITDLGPQVGAAIEAQKATEAAARELEQATKRLTEARSELANAKTSGNLKDIYSAEKKVSSAESTVELKQAALQQLKDQTIKVNVEPGRVDLPEVPTEISVPLTAANLDAFTSQLKQDLSVADFGSIDYNQIFGNLNDSVALGEFIKTAMAAGVDSTELGEVGQAIWAKILNKENIDPSVFEGLYDILGQATGENYVFDEKKGTAEVKEDKSFEDFSKGLNTVAGGLSNVTSGLQTLGVEIPKEVDDAINVMNAVGQIIAGVQAVISLIQTPAQTSNTIALGLNTGALTALALAVQSNTFSNFIPFFSNGGLVGRAADGMLIPGTSYSGDRLRMPVTGGGFIGVNSGELILNTSSQKNLAAEIMAAQQLVKMIDAEGAVLSSSQRIGLMESLSEPSGQPPRDATPYVDGEVIWLGLGNYLKGAGIGEIVTTNRR